MRAKKKYVVKVYVKYRVYILDFNEGGKVILNKPVKDLSEARSICSGVETDYYENAKAFIGFKDNKEYIIKEE